LNLAGFDGEPAAHETRVVLPILRVHRIHAIHLHADHIPNACDRRWRRALICMSNQSCGAQCEKAERP
jgi:hypothetical protein